jgi:N-acetylmuramic acid 6-phosphate etherase
LAGERSVAGLSPVKKDERIPTESVNPVSRGIDVKSAAEIVAIIHGEDLRAWEAIGVALQVIADVVEEVVRAFQAGGRLIYVGAGSSGRLGVLDAAECPPTFGVDPERVRGIIAGGDSALRNPVEGAEDFPADGAAEIRRAGVRSKDVVCAIAASGTTPYVWGALQEASVRDATTVLITCNPKWSEHASSNMVDFPILIPVGPEIIAGSSRMKAGTATKMVLNIVSTAAMIRWGKVYDNLMVDLTPVNQKLRQRAVGLVSAIADVDVDHASELLRASGGNVKAAVVIGRSGVDPLRAKEILERHAGVLRYALEDEVIQEPAPLETRRPETRIDGVDGVDGENEKKVS